MAEQSGGEGGERAQAPSTGRETDRATQARLAHRLQHLKTLRASREAQAYWEHDLAQRAREELARQREAAREADEERTRQRLQAFLDRERAARPTGAARRELLVFSVPGVDEPQIGDVRSVQVAVAIDDADAGEMTG